MSESTHQEPAPRIENFYEFVDISNIERFGETWLLNSQLKYSDKQNFSCIHFISNGKSFDTISHYEKDGRECLYYNLTKVNNGSPLWVDDKYRIISFTYKIDDKLLNWLKNNGIKI